MQYLACPNKKTVIKLKARKCGIRGLHDYQFCLSKGRKLATAGSTSQ